MVGNAALMRLSSVTLPSAMGTLKSTRIKTRLPLRSISFTVFLFMIAPIYKNRYTGFCCVPVYLFVSFLLQTFRHQCREISSAGCIAPFVIIPSHHFDHVAKDNCIHGAENTGELGAAQVCRDERLISDIQNAFHRTISILKHGRTNFLRGSFLVQDRGKINNRYCGSGHAESHASELALEFRN